MALKLEDKIIHPGDILDERIEEIKAKWKRGKELSLDFLPTLDNKIWGLQRGKLIVIGGRPSQGKSTLMLQMAYSFAKQKRKVMFFTLEMSNKVCLDRLLSYGCEIDNFIINTGKLKELDLLYKDRINKFKKELSETNLVFIESWGRNFKEINHAISSTSDTPDVVFIDYINMIRQGGRNKREAIDEYIKELREFALDKNFCVIIGCQLNRDVHKHQDEAPRVPDLWHIKESGHLEEHADQVFLLHYPFHYTKKSEDEGNYIIKIAKNREGRTGSFKCTFQPEFYKIGEKNVEE